MPLLFFTILTTEFTAFIFFNSHFGFLNTLGIYLLPCFLGYFILTIVGRLSLLTIQSRLHKGELPGMSLIHSGAIFLSGLLFILPTLTSRVIAALLLLPGTRHLIAWRFSHFLKKKLATGASAFSFGNGHFSFTSGFGGFKRHSYEAAEETFSNQREVHETHIVDVTPLKVTHEKKDPSDT